MIAFICLAILAASEGTMEPDRNPDRHALCEFRGEAEGGRRRRRPNRARNEPPDEHAGNADLIRGAVAAGVNVIDTAHTYTAGETT
jgi:hypothetical protein